MVIVESRQKGTALAVDYRFALQTRQSRCNGIDLVAINANVDKGAVDLYVFQQHCDETPAMLTSMRLRRPLASAVNAAAAAAKPEIGSAIASAQNTGPSSSQQTNPPATAASSPNPTPSLARP